MTTFHVTLLVAAGLGLAVVAALLAVSVHKTGKRKEERFDLAMRELGLSRLQKSAHAAELAYLRGARKLTGGAKNVGKAWRGEWEGRSFECVHHRYVVSTGKSTVVVQHRLIATPVPKSWPELHLAEENILTRLGSVLGIRDLQLEDEAFNKRWRIRTDDKDFALMLLVPELQAMLRESPRGQQWLIVRGRLILMEKGEFKPEEIGPALAQLMDFCDLIPPELEAYRASERR